jgi:general secretion pathway protein D
MSYAMRCIALFGLIGMVAVSNLSAGTCDNKLFSLNIESTPQNKITIQDVLSDLASSCKISVLYADAMTKSKLKEDLDALYINDYTLEELFQLILHEHNLFYTFDQSLSRLKISYIKTKSFNIDYINVTQMRTYSARDVTVGASTNANEDMQAITGGQQSSGNSRESGSQKLIEYSSIGSIQKGENSDFTSTKTIADFTFWDELKLQIDGMMQRDGDTNEVRSFSMINRDAGLITVSGSYKQLDRVEKYIENLQQRMHKQVLLEVRILEVTFTEGQQIGIDWSAFNLSLSGLAGATVSRGTQSTNDSSDIYTAGFNFTMEGLMNFLKTYGEVEILSSPKVMTLNNQPALINVGDQINYKYETGQLDAVGIGTPSASTTFSLGSVFVGLSLTIIPEITENGHIILRINPVDSRIINEDDEGADPELTTDETTPANVRSIPPDMKVKQLTSIVKVKDGSKVLVGGLVQKEKFMVDNKVPVIGDIPYLGRLFHSTTTKNIKKEFFVVVVPTIIKENRMPTIEEQEIITRTEGHQFDMNASSENTDGQL